PGPSRLPKSVQPGSAVAVKTTRSHAQACHRRGVTRGVMEALPQGQFRPQKCSNYRTTGRGGISLSARDLRGTKNSARPPTPATAGASHAPTSRGHPTAAGVAASARPSARRQGPGVLREENPPDPEGQLL